MANNFIPKALFIFDSENTVCNFITKNLSEPKKNHFLCSFDIQANEFFKLKLLNNSILRPTQP